MAAYVNDVTFNVTWSCDEKGLLEDDDDDDGVDDGEDLAWGRSFFVLLKQTVLMSIVLSVHPGVQIAYELYDLYPGGQQKKFLPFGHGRDLVALTVPAYRTSFSRIGPR